VDAVTRARIDAFLLQVKTKLSHELVKEDDMKAAALVLRPQDYNDVLIDRTDSERCAFPTCTKKLTSNAIHDHTLSKLVQGSIHSNISSHHPPEGAFFCSKSCLKQSQEYYVQLSEEHLSMRKHMQKYFNAPVQTKSPTSNASASMTSAKNVKQKTDALKENSLSQTAETELKTSACPSTDVKQFQNSQSMTSTDDLLTSASSSSKLSKKSGSKSSKKSSSATHSHGPLQYEVKERDIPNNLQQVSNLPNIQETSTETSNDLSSSLQQLAIDPMKEDAQSMQFTLPNGTPATNVPLKSASSSVPPKRRVYGSNKPSTASVSANATTTQVPSPSVSVASTAIPEEFYAAHEKNKLSADSDDDDETNDPDFFANASELYLKRASQFEHAILFLSPCLQAKTFNFITGCSHAPRAKSSTLNDPDRVNMLYQLISQQVPLVVRALKLSHSVHTQDIKELIDTFTLEKPIPTLKVSTWIFMTIVFLKLLSVRQALHAIKNSQSALMEEKQQSLSSEMKDTLDQYINCTHCQPLLAPVLLNRKWLKETKTPGFSSHDDSHLESTLKDCGFTVQHVLSLVSICTDHVV
jgi:hypothetical protein